MISLGGALGYQLERQNLGGDVRSWTETQCFVLAGASYDVFLASRYPFVSGELTVGVPDWLFLGP